MTLEEIIKLLVIDGLSRIDRDLTILGCKYTLTAYRMSGCIRIDLKPST